MKNTNWKSSTVYKPIYTAVSNRLLPASKIKQGEDNIWGLMPGSHPPKDRDNTIHEGKKFSASQRRKKSNAELLTYCSSSSGGVQDSSMSWNTESK